MGVHRSGGFTLLKFTVSLILVNAIALGIAPVYYKLMNNLHATSFTNGLVQSLQLARTQAVKRGNAVSVCASDNGNTCTDTPWSHGYIVFVDGNTPGVVDGEDGVIEITRTHNQRVNVTLTGGRFVRFLSNGGLVAQAPVTTPVMTATANPSWFSSLSPIATAMANDEFPQDRSVNTGESATAMRTGAFTVCAGPSGRAINISYLGRISTSRVPCE